MSIQKKRTIHDLFLKKQRREKIFEAAIYDYPTARAAERAGVDIFIVGVSLRMNLLGFAYTISVTIAMMTLFTQAVRRGAPHSFVIADMPFGTYFTAEQAYRHACDLVRAGADGIKIEGGREVSDVVHGLSRREILVHGHIGLVPQSYRKLGGFRTQGRDARNAAQLIDDARALEDAGCMLLLVEAMPPPVAQVITEKLAIPVVGVGAGSLCDGVALVLNDFVGWAHIEHPPRYAKQYCDVAEVLTQAITELKQDIEQGRYPAPEHYYTMRTEEEERSFRAGREKKDTSTP